MAKFSPDKVLADTARILTVWQANPEFGLGTTRLPDLQAAYDALQQADALVETKRVELTGLMDQRDDQAAALNDLNTRARSGFRAAYGPDSAQYAQAGGTRRSERKPRARKATPAA